MNASILSQIIIRTELRPGDLGYIVYRHAKIFWNENSYGLDNEKYVMSAMLEFYEGYLLKQNRIWLCENNGQIIGSIALVHRSPETAQLRFFLIEPSYRGMGIGKRLLSLFLTDLSDSGYKNCYLWTTDELEIAASLYEGFGFKIVEEKRSKTLGKSVIEQRYELLLHQINNYQIIKK